MTRTDIIAGLTNRGYKAEATEVVKNGVTLEGIVIKDETNIAPVIYTDKIIEHAEQNNISLDEVVEHFINQYNEAKVNNFDVRRYLSPDYVKANIYIGLQRKSEQPLVKRSTEFDGIESYLYIKGNSEVGNFLIKVTDNILLATKVPEADLWEMAQANVENDTLLLDFATLIETMTGKQLPQSAKENPLFYIISNSHQFHGAAAILNKKALAQFGKDHSTDKIIVIPSSIHECIITPYTEDIDIDEWSQMVVDVNGSAVEPEEQLGDKPYILTI